MPTMRDYKMALPWRHIVRLSSRAPAIRPGLGPPFRRLAASSEGGSPQRVVTVYVIRGRCNSASES